MVAMFRGPEVYIILPSTVFDVVCKILPFDVILRNFISDDVKFWRDTKMVANALNKLFVFTFFCLFLGVFINITSSINFHP